MSTLCCTVSFIIITVTTCVFSYSNGFELGILFPTDSGDFRMQKKNREEFPDFTIERDDIIRIYRVIMMVRIY